MKLPRKITVDWLRRKGACAPACAKFEQVFPNGAAISKQTMKLAQENGLNVFWLVLAVSSGSAVHTRLLEYGNAIPVTTESKPLDLRVFYAAIHGGLRAMQRVCRSSRLVQSRLDHFPTRSHDWFASLWNQGK